MFVPPWHSHLHKYMYICTIVNWNRNFALAISSQNIDNVKCSINKLRTSRTKLWRNSPKQIENENSTWIYVFYILYTSQIIYVFLFGFSENSSWGSWAGRWHSQWRTLWNIHSFTHSTLCDFPSLLYPVPANTVSNDCYGQLWMNEWMNW